MFSFRSKFKQAKAIKVAEQGFPRYPPQVHQFQSIDDWFLAWLSYRLEEARGTTLIQAINGRPCLSLIGSIGLDSAIAEDGTFLIQLGFEDDVQWREATAMERTSLTVCAQRRRFPEFSVLLPLRSADALRCESCAGTGFLVHNTVVCESCSALGWLGKPL